MSIYEISLHLSKHYTAMRGDLQMLEMLCDDGDEFSQWCSRAWELVEVEAAQVMSEGVMHDIWPSTYPDLQMPPAQ